MTDMWRERAEQAGLKGLYLVGFSSSPLFVAQEYGLDGSLVGRLPERWISRRRPIQWLVRKLQVKMGKSAIYSYKQLVSELLRDQISNDGEYPCVIPNWDNTARGGKNGLVLYGSTPELFRNYFRHALQIIQNYPSEHKIVFINSWNERAEGNHLEPDLKFGTGYLKVLKEEIENGLR
jgi:hypothetical protein